MTYEDIIIIVKVNFNGNKCNKKCPYLNKSHCNLFHSPLIAANKETLPIELYRCIQCIENKKNINDIKELISSIESKQKINIPSQIQMSILKPNDKITDVEENEDDEDIIN